MNGLELARAYYETYGAPMLQEQFADLLPHLAAGLLGSGSECFGFDDALSRDHDFEPGFCLFLPGEETVDRRVAFMLERAYAKLPKEFEGIQRATLQPVGGPRHGVLRIGEFFTEKIGSADGVLTTAQWLTVPEAALAECVNGQVFFDNAGLLTALRERLAYYPEDVRRKKLAGHLLLMAQAGQYNYLRCVGHGENAAAQLAVNQFVTSTLSVLFLLNRTYQPFYKWSFRAARALPELSLLPELLEALLVGDNEGDQPQAKADMIESIAADVIDCLMAQGLTKATCGDLEKHAYSVNDGIADPALRNRHVLAAV